MTSEETPDRPVSPEEHSPASEATDQTADETKTHRPKSGAPHHKGSSRPRRSGVVADAINALRGSAVPDAPSLAAGMLPNHGILSAADLHRIPSGVASAGELVRPFYDSLSASVIGFNSLSSVSGLSSLAQQTEVLAKFDAVEQGHLRTLFAEQERVGRRLSTAFDGMVGPALGTLGPVLDGFRLAAGSLSSVSMLAAAVGEQSFAFRQSQLLASSWHELVGDLAVGAGGFPSLVAAELDIGRKILDTASASLARMAEVESSSAASWDDSTPITVFRVLDEEIEERRDDILALPQERIPVAVGETLAARTSGAARLVADLRLAVAEACALRGKRSIFSATARTERVSFRLATVVVSTAEDLGRLASDLYVYVYESSGDWKRVSEVIPDFPRVADAIKHLRLQEAHDVEHGDRAKVRAKWRAIGDDLEWLCGERTPSDPWAWRRCQARLMEELASFLDQLNRLLRGVPIGRSMAISPS